LQKEYLTRGRPLFVPDGEVVLNKSKQLMDVARRKSISIVHVKHISKNPNDNTFNKNSPLVDLAYETRDQEPIITKHLPGAFYSTNLDEVLKSRGVEVVAILGLLSFMCCDTTAREAHARGYKVLFLEDATAAIDIGGINHRDVHKTVCAIQSWMFSEVLTSSQLIERIEGGEFI